MKTMSLYLRSIVLFILILLVDVTILALWGQGSWDTRLGLILQIIGFYSIAIGFILKSDTLKDFAGIDDLTSPNLVKFVRANFLFISFLFGFGAVALSVNRSAKESVPLGCLGQFLVFLLLPFFVVYCIFHLMVIMPFAYVGYVFSSALVESIIGSGAEVEYAVTSLGNSSQIKHISEAIKSNPAAAKSFLIGIAAAILSLATRLIAMFIS